jgi:hypothetical protein
MEARKKAKMGGKEEISGSSAGVGRICAEFLSRQRLTRMRVRLSSAAKAANLRVGRRNLMTPQKILQVRRACKVSPFVAQNRKGAFL